jgi:Arc/MetJ family transcription regulator
VRTNIVIDDQLMKETLRSTGLKTKREAVELGLRTLLRLSKQAEIRRFRGQLRWRGDLEAMRSRSLPLVDSSVWIGYFNGIVTPATNRLDELLSHAVLAAGDLILAEVLQGIADDR